MPSPNWPRRWPRTPSIWPTRNLSPADRQEGLLTRAGYLFRLHRAAECLALLDQIPPAAGLGGRATLLRGQILYEEARSLLAKPAATAADRRAARHKLDLAIEAFRLAQSRDTVSNRATRQAMYLTGLCLATWATATGPWSNWSGLPSCLPAIPRPWPPRCKRPNSGGRPSAMPTPWPPIATCWGRLPIPRVFTTPGLRWSSCARACWPPIAAIWRRGISRWPCS